MQYPEITSVAVEQAWSKPGSLKPRGGHHLEPQGFKGLFVSGTTGHFIIHRGGGARHLVLAATPSLRQRVAAQHTPQSAAEPSHG